MDARIPVQLISAVPMSTIDNTVRTRIEQGQGSRHPKTLVTTAQFVQTSFGSCRGGGGVDSSAYGGMQDA